MTVLEFYRAFDERIPRTLSASWDHDGLAVCPDENAPVRRVMCVLDVTPEAIAEAKKGGYDVILTHHPLLFRPVDSLSAAIPTAKMARECLLAGISVLNFHTRADAVEGGVNDCLLSVLDCTPDEPVPGEMFRSGTLKTPMTADDFARFLAEKLGVRAMRYTDGGRLITRVGVVGGSGREFISLALSRGCEAFVSGEIGHHSLTDAPGMGISVFECGHYETEKPVLPFLASLASTYCPAADVRIFDLTPIRTL